MKFFREESKEKEKVDFLGNKTIVKRKSLTKFEIGNEKNPQKTQKSTISKVTEWIKFLLVVAELIRTITNGLIYYIYNRFFILERDLYEIG